MYPPDVLCQSLTNLRNEAAAGHAAKLVEQLPSPQDAILPGSGLIVKDGTGLRRLLEQTCRGACLWSPQNVRRRLALDVPRSR